MKGGWSLANEVTDFHSTPIHALTTTVTSPMSGIPMNTSPNMNNASLTRIGKLQKLQHRLIENNALTFDKDRMINDLYAIFANQTLLAQV